MNASSTSASAAVPFVVLDFDSTLVKVETLDALADMVLSESVEADAIRTRVARLTDQAMAGDIDFGEALKRRLELLQLNRTHVEALADRILGELTPSVRRNARFFAENADRIIILSGGFREIIAPVAAELGVPPERVLANDLLYDDEGRVTGVDETNPLSREGGKAEALKALNLPGPVILIGDGWNRDYGRVARARLTRAWWNGGAFETELLEDRPAQFVNRMGTHWARKLTISRMDA